MAYQAVVWSQLAFKLDLTESVSANISLPFNQGRINLSDWSEGQELSMASVLRHQFLTSSVERKAFSLLILHNTVIEAGWTPDVTQDSMLL